MGGEPLLRFDLIKQLVPYAQTRAGQRGKDIRFNVSTNCIASYGQMISFWKKYGMLFHCSIDGLPKVQNRNRPMVGGKPSSRAVEMNVPRILAFQPDATARATVTPDSVSYLAQSAEYLLKLGFRLMAFVPGIINCDWQARHLEILREEYHKLGRFYIDQLASGGRAVISDLSRGLRALHSVQPASRLPCGAGSSSAMIDPVGNIYPCTAFGPKQCRGQFRLGRLGEPFNDRLRDVFLNYDLFTDGRGECHSCRARLTCRDWCFAACTESSLSLYSPGKAHCEVRRIIHDEIVEVDDYLKCHHSDALKLVVKDVASN